MRKRRFKDGYYFIVYVNYETLDGDIFKRKTYCYRDNKEQAERDFKLNYDNGKNIFVGEVIKGISTRFNDKIVKINSSSVG